MFPKINRTVKHARFPGRFLPFPNTTMRMQLFFTFCLLFAINSAAQELTGPDSIALGTLASFEVVPAQEASWHIVTPLSGVETYQVDTGLSKLYFASPERGRYTVVAGIIVDEKPRLLVKTFVNGDEDFKPLPIPTPPPSSLEVWIKTQLPIMVTSKNLVSEVRLVAECFEQIVQRIDEGNIKTAPNAQAQLQITLTGTLALASPTAVSDWMPLLSELSQRLEEKLGEKISDIEEVKKTLQTIGSAMKSFEVPQNAPVLKAPLPDIDNPNNRGQGTPNRNVRTLLTR